jgi:hypothetical protein
VLSSGKGSLSLPHNAFSNLQEGDVNKLVSVLHWLNHVQTDAEYLVILDADMIMRRPITPWEFGAECGRPVATPYK